MTSPLGSLIVVSGVARAVQITRALDSVVRQTQRPVRLVVASAALDPVQAAAAVRVGADVETSSDAVTAINRAVSANACEWLLVVPPGF